MLIAAAVAVPIPPASAPAREQRFRMERQAAAFQEPLLQLPVLLQQQLLLLPLPLLSPQEPCLLQLKEARHLTQQE
jgi:hypothetical protein